MRVHSVPSFCSLRPGTHFQNRSFSNSSSVTPSEPNAPFAWKGVRVPSSASVCVTSLEMFASSSSSQKSTIAESTATTPVPHKDFSD